MSCCCLRTHPRTPSRTHARTHTHSPGGNIRGKVNFNIYDWNLHIQHRSHTKHWTQAVSATTLSPYGQTDTHTRVCAAVPTRQIITFARRESAVRLRHKSATAAATEAAFGSHNRPPAYAAPFSAHHPTHTRTRTRRRARVSPPETHPETFNWLERRNRDICRRTLILICKSQTRGDAHTPPAGTATAGDQSFAFYGTYHSTHYKNMAFVFPSKLLRDRTVRLVASCAFKTQFQPAAIACIISCPWVCLHIILQLFWLATVML